VTRSENGAMVVSITEAESIFKTTTALHHLNLWDELKEQIKLFQPSSARCLLQQDIGISSYCLLNYLTILYLELCFKGLSSFEIVYEYLPGDYPFDLLSLSIPQFLGYEVIECAERNRES
jgi:hypothetical protein